MLDTKSWERIARYALGECTAEGAVATRVWIEADPERKALADELVRLADAGPTAIWDARKAWRRFTDEEKIGTFAARWEPVTDATRGRSGERPITIGSLKAGRVSGRACSTRPRRRGWLLSMAAVLVVAGGAAGLWPAIRDTVGARAAEDLREISTRPRQTTEIYLSDGSRVVLAPASTIRFPNRFSRGRVVILEGEAYFDVAPARRMLGRSKRHFTVHTERAVARDLGTRFTVRAYPGSGRTEVAVAEGAVSLAAAVANGPERPVADSLILTRGDVGQLDETGAITVIRDVDVTDHLAWMEGRLVFLDAPASEVVVRFRHWFDVNLQFGDSALARARVTATFDVASPAGAIDLLAVVLDARIKRDGDASVLHRDGHGR